MKDECLQLPWTKMILRSWLSLDESTEYEKIKEYGESIQAIRMDGDFVHVDHEWLEQQIDSRNGVDLLDSPEKLALALLGIGEMMARTPHYDIRKITDYIRSSTVIEDIPTCLECIEQLVNPFFPKNITIPLEARGILQFINSCEVSFEDLKTSEKLFERGPHSLFRHDQHGLPNGLRLLLRIDAQSVGVWLKRQTHPFALDAALYALQYSFLMFTSSGNENEVFQLVKSEHPLIFFAGINVLHGSFQYDQPSWNIGIEESFNILKRAQICINTQIWCSMFRLNEISERLQSITDNVTRAKNEYSVSLYKLNMQEHELDWHKNRVSIFENQFLALDSELNKTIDSIVSNWPINGICVDALNFCALAMHITESWLKFLVMISHQENKEFLIKRYIKNFSDKVSLFQTSKTDHCFASVRTLDDIPLVAKAFLLLPCENIGKNFGNMFFGNSKRTLKREENILLEPYSFRKEYRKFNNALNRLGIAHSLALHIALFGESQCADGAKFLRKMAIQGLIKTIAAAQGHWSVADDALQKLSLLAIETLISHSDSLSYEELVRYIALPNLPYAFKAMLCWYSFEFYYEHRDMAFSLLERTLWEPIDRTEYHSRLPQIILAFDLSLLTLAKANYVDEITKIIELWNKGCKQWNDMLPEDIRYSIANIAKALLGDMKMRAWLNGSQNFSNTWSAIHLRAIPLDAIPNDTGTAC